MPTRPAPLFPKIPAAAGDVPSLEAGGAPVWVDFEGFGENAIREDWPWEGGATATLKLKCYWQDRYAVAKGLRGGVVVSGTKWRYYPIAPYPYSTNLYCMSISNMRGIKPYADGVGLVQNEFARFEANYGILPYTPFGSTEPISDASGQPMTTTKFKGSANVFAPPRGSYRFVSSGKLVPDNGVGLIQAQVEINMVRRMVPIPAVFGPASLMGTTNGDPIALGDNIFPAGYLLFTGFDTSEHPDPAEGIMAWDYEMQILGRTVSSWNALVNDVGAYELIQNASGTPPFPPADWSVLQSPYL